jgi:hypothetical protein
LTIVRSMMTSVEDRKAQELHAEAEKALESEDLDMYLRIKAAANEIGRFVPILEAPRTADDQFFVVPTQMSADQRAFIAFVYPFLGIIGDCAT